MENLNVSELETVGTLLCHASSSEMRAEYPIEGDLLETEQSIFEVSIFGMLSPMRGKPAVEDDGTIKEISEFSVRGSNETL